MKSLTIGSVTFLAAALLLLGAPDAGALSITVSPLSTADVDVTTSIDEVNEVITITEVWNTSGVLLLEFSQREEFLNSWKIVKEKTNNTGTPWTSFEEELMQPTFAQLAAVVIGWHGSNDSDQLDFAQGEGLPRTSTTFQDYMVDELADRDFLLFYNGTVSGSGGVDVQSFYVDMPFTGDPDGTGPPFALREEPNVRVIPEPSTLALAILGLTGLGLLARRRRS